MPDTRLHVAIADDQDYVREAIDTQIRSMGHDTTLFASARDLLSHIETHPCDAIITDNNMPGMTGLEMLEVLRSDSRFKHLPVLVVSGYDIRDQVDRLSASFTMKPAPEGTYEAFLREAGAET